MPNPSSQSTRLAADADVPDPLPEVRLEVRQGSGPATTHVVSDVGFLIGTVPGCDLRVPGGGLPAVLCLISRRPSGASFRKLAPTQALLVNGQTAAQTLLQDGDRLTVGALDLYVRIHAAAWERPAPAATSQTAALVVEKAQQDLQKKITQFRAEVQRFQKERESIQKEQLEQTRALLERAARLDERQRQLEARPRQEPVPDPWKKEKPGKLDQEQAAAYQDLEQREQALAKHVAELAQREKALAGRTEELEREKQDLAKVRQELADIRKQLYDRYQERRDRLAGLQEAVSRAARKVQERKQQLDTEIREAAARVEEYAERRAELDARGAEIADLVNQFDNERRLFQASKATLQQEVDRKLADLQTREEALAAARRELEKKQHQHQADLVRLDRLQAALDERERQLQERSQEMEQRFAQLQRDSQDLEEQVVQFDELGAKLKEDGERLAKQKAEQDAKELQLAQRAAALEGQQATLASLRTRLERMREEVRREEQRLAEERARQEQTEAELQQHLQESLQRQADLENDQKLRDKERQQHVERNAVLDAAVNQLRQAQEKLAAEEEKLRQRANELDRKGTEQGDQAGMIQSRLGQLAEAQERLEAERQALRERTQNLVQAEQVREKLQEQLRRRSEELAARQRELAEQAQKLDAQAAVMQGTHAELERKQQLAQEELKSRQRELETQAAALASKDADARQREETLHQQLGKLQETGRLVSGERKALAQERVQIKLQQEQLAELQARHRADFESLCQEARELVQHLPDLELKAGTALERLTHAREQLRDHLGEVHAFARQCQDDLESLRDQIQAEAERVQQQEQALRRNQNEHRLAVADFRQQLIDWQGQVADKKRLLVQDETRLERKEAQVSEKAREMDAARQRLAQKVETLQEQERAVADRRQEIDRHLADMREWYRKKLRELAGTEDANHPSDGTEGEIEEVTENHLLAEDAVPTARRNILSLTGPADEADQRLGDLLRSLELVDADSLTALLAEARRQRRSLRQVLLSSGVVTIYQMALIEAGNVDALMLGPVRVVDRLRVTARETVYRVFDPRRGQEAVLRHLAEQEMEDAVHPDEYRQRFAQAQVDHPHLARTLEVLEIAGRPAVLQEWLVGLPCPDWPPLASVPGVCFRLLSQAALGLATVHEAGLVHGRLADNMLLLTRDGTLKICGLGEPAWLAATPYPEPASAAADLAALGKIADGWSTSGVRKGAKTKPLPQVLLDIIKRLQSGDTPYLTASALLEHLDRISSEVPANAEAWDRLLKYVRDHATPEVVLRKSA